MPQMGFLFILPIITVIIFFIARKNKGDHDSKSVLNDRDNRKDEVWRTIKSFIKTNQEFGKKIVSSFLAKRPNVFNKSATKKKFY